MTETQTKEQPKPLGIIQSRGLGDILIALPIARYYYDQGRKIVWPIANEFIPAVRAYAPWVEWIGMESDAAGAFFLQTPLQLFRERGINPDEDSIYLYQYLNVVPELTNPEFYNILKFDQYKYQMAGVPFVRKWTLASCVNRDSVREATLLDRLAQDFNMTKPYAVAHLTGSSAKVDVALVKNLVDPAVQIINVDLYLDAESSPFDWWGVIERAEAFIGLDSSFTNMVDQLGIQGPKLYWIRRSAWDLTPVLGSAWRFVPTNLPIKEPQRVDPGAEAARKRGQAALTAAPTQPTSSPSKSMGSTGLTSHVPFQTNQSKIPKNFMHALRK